MLLEKSFDEDYSFNFSLFEKIILIYFVLFGLFQSFKNFVLSWVSLLGGSTEKERNLRFRFLYFKGAHHVLGNPFYKGIWGNFYENFIAFIGYVPRNRKVEANSGGALYTIAEVDEEAETENKKGPDYEELVNRSLTEGRVNWGNQMVLTMMEIDCLARENLITILDRKRKLGKSLEDDDTDTESEDSDEEQYSRNTFVEGKNKGGECKTCDDCS